MVVDLFSSLIKVQHTATPCMHSDSNHLMQRVHRKGQSQIIEQPKLESTSESEKPSTEQSHRTAQSLHSNTTKFSQQSNL